MGYFYVNRHICARDAGVSPKGLARVDTAMAGQDTVVSDPGFAAILGPNVVIF